MQVDFENAFNGVKRSKMMSKVEWRHKARVQRMEEMKGKTDAVVAEKKRFAAKLKDTQDVVKKEELKGGENLTQVEEKFD